MTAMTVPSKTVQVDGRFVMHRGGFLESPTIANETWGELQGKGDNANQLYTGLSPSGGHDRVRLAAGH